VKHFKTSVTQFKTRLGGGDKNSRDVVSLTIPLAQMKLLFFKVCSENSETPCAECTDVNFVVKTTAVTVYIYYDLHRWNSFRVVSLILRAGTYTICLCINSMIHHRNLYCKASEKQLTTTTTTVFAFFKNNTRRVQRVPTCVSELLIRYDPKYHHPTCTRYPSSINVIIRLRCNVKTVSLRCVNAS